MAAVIERERRWLVRAYDHSIIKDRPRRMITQGYFDVLGEKSLRVRLVRERGLEEAFITLKEGKGEVRLEHEVSTDLPGARLMVGASMFRVEKLRYVIDGFELDVFLGPLEGIVLLEYEAKGDEPFPPLPPWIHDAIDVTDSLTNLHLARLAHELREHAPTAVSRFLEPRLPKVVLTGGPCSGKSTLMREIQELYGDRVHCVQEVATILISEVGLRPDPKDAHMYESFQRTLYAVQRSFEEAAELQALRDGKKILVLDRGTVDAVAYMPAENGYDREEAFEALVRRKVGDELGRYRHVIVLAVPSKETYEAHCANNPARTETYERAVMLGERIAEVWRICGENGNERIRFRPTLVDIPRMYVTELAAHYVDAEAWSDKRQAVLSDIEYFIRS